MRASTSFRSRPVLTLLLALVACGDDHTGPAEPDPPLWEAVALSAVPEASAILGIRSSQTRTLAVATGTDGPFVLEYFPTGWEREDLASSNSTFAFDVEFAPDGRAVVVGGHIDGTARVWAERPDWTVVPLSLSGTLLSVTRDDAGLFAATGATGNAIPLARGTIDGAWTAGSVPMPSTAQEKSLEKIVAVGTELFACGWDDGGDGTSQFPYHLLLHFDGQAWALAESPCGGCAHREFTALAARSGGGLVLGGAHTDWAAGATDPSIAALALFDPVGEEWIEIVVPAAGVLDRVNDIEVTAAGALLLGCGRDGAGSIALLPASGGGALEWNHDDAAIHAVAEAHDGTLLAGGRGPDGRAMLLRRRAAP